MITIRKVGDTYMVHVHSANCIVPMDSLKKAKELARFRMERFYPLDVDLIKIPFKDFWIVI